ncbi:MAG: flagellar biosynthetic protein FliR, partial [Lachnospiraceae bacterium]|nr:flagellar biosynthetic protein FliR [Lachnospiraceae bacterium]
MIHVTFGYAELEYFLLILTRVTCFVYISPFFSTRNTPNMVRIAFSLFLAYLVSSYLPHTALAYDTLTGYIVMIMKEAVTGFLIGFGASLCMTVISFAGRIIDMEIGLMMASV